ncbi:MAG: hypothetical protein KBT27_16360 [Prevotellaceae bacterium]|nr:hypothetical protein [Candidatus Faecinaster equi]
MKNSTKVFTNTAKIEMLAINSTIKIGEIVKGYVNNSETDEGGVFSMDGRLNIRPRYQRAYIADTTTNWRENLINSLICGFPINRLYIGVDKDENKSVDEANIEMLDGQQRTITICDFVIGNFAIQYEGMPCHFDNLPTEIREAILDYDLDVTYCKGSEAARIAWFKRINQPNSILTPQELRNSTYIGAWLENNKRRFCAPTAHAKKQITDKDDKYCASKYISGCKIERSEYLEAVLDWVSYNEYPEMRKATMDDRICRYMSEHQNDEPNDDLFNYYKKVVDWANETFFNFDKETKYPQSFAGVEWGRLYAEHKDEALDGKYISKRVKELLVIQACFGKPAGLYEWVLLGERDDNTNLMQPRTFNKEYREKQYALQGGIDPFTMEHHDISEMDAHHIISWKNGGTTDMSNLVLCTEESHYKYIHGGVYNSEQVQEKRDALMEMVRKNKLANSRIK